MKAIKFYFAGGWGEPNTSEAILIKNSIKNKLISYAYPNQLKEWMKNFTSDMESNIIIDSGAFSAWNNGKVIDLQAYIDYAQKALEQLSKFKKVNVHIVNLDVIPGVVGQTTTLNKIRKKENQDLKELSAKQGFRNMRRMIKAGLKPIHVFHQGEDFSWIDKMVEYVSYIGISPANDLPWRTRTEWISTVFEYLYKRGITVDTHGFAVTTFATLRDFPWTSCDAATWKIGAGMGLIKYPKGGFRNPDYSCPPFTLAVSNRKIGKGTKHMQPLFLKQLKVDGYSYADLQTRACRTLINARCQLGLEKWLNKYKAKTTYKPHTSFGFAGN